MEDSFTRHIAHYLSNNLSDMFRDNKIFEQNALNELSQMICKTLEVTNFIEDNAHYKLDVEKESDTVLSFRVIKYV